MQIHVRAIKESDKESWLNLWQGYLTFYNSTLSAVQTELTWQRFLDPNFNSYGLVAEVEDQVIGLTHYSFQETTWADVGFCYLEDLFVEPRLRGSGAGAALIDRVKEIAEAAQCSRLYWNTDATNTTARTLYDKYIKESGRVQYRIPLNNL